MSTNTTFSDSAFSSTPDSSTVVPTNQPTSAAFTVSSESSINETCFCNITDFWGDWADSIDENATFEEMIAALTLDADSLSSTKRKYKSAPDSRPTAASLGVIGTVIIVSVIGFIVYLDSATLVSQMFRLKRKYMRLKRQISRKSICSRVDPEQQSAESQVEVELPELRPDPTDAKIHEPEESDVNEAMEDIPEQSELDTPDQ